MATANPPAGLIDSTVLIDASRNHPAANQFLAAQSTAGALFISVITAMELIQGCRDARHLRATRQFLRQFRVFHPTRNTCRSAYQLLVRFTLSHGLRIPDALIAATGLARGLALYTQNLRHFQMIPGLTVIKPY